MSEHLAAAAAAVGIPEDLVQRSADARAAADGVDADALIAAWAGGAAAPTGTPPPAEPPPAAAPPVEAQPVSEVETATESIPDVAHAAPAMAGAVAAPAAPARVTQAQALDYHAVITVPTAGIAERTTSGTPRWLSMLFLIVPLAGLMYLVTFANGPNCGVGGQLSVDRLTGVVENCDGSTFAAAGAPGGIDLGAIIRQGQTIYAGTAGNCTACHGEAGGGGVGPAFSSGAVLATFASCTDHLDWVGLGTAGFQSAGLGTYGDQAKTVGEGGQMPGFDQTLSPGELAAVVLYERVNFGGQDADEAAVDCGLVSPEDEQAEPTALDQ